MSNAVVRFELRWNVGDHADYRPNSRRFLSEAAARDYIRRSVVRHKTLRLFKVTVTEEELPLSD